MAGKISDLTAASSVADADQFELLQGGTNKRATAAMVRAGLAASSHTHVAANVSDFSEAVDDRVNALLVEGTGITLTYDDVANTLTVDAAGGGGTIDGSGTAGRGARWTDTDTLAAGGVQDDGTRAGVGAAPAAAATLTVKAQTGDTACLRLEGTGGVIIPKVLFEHPGQTGVAVQGDNTGFQFNNDGEGVTLYVVPGYPQAYVKTHPSSAGRLVLQSHNGSGYVDCLSVINGTVEIWDGAAWKAIGFGAADSESSGFRNLRVAN